MVGRSVVVKTGPYAGLHGRIVKELKRTVRIIAVGNDNESDDDDSDYFYNGDEFVVSKNDLGSLDDEVAVLNKQIAKGLISLHGIVLKKLQLSNPSEADKEIARILAFVEKG